MISNPTASQSVDASAAVTLGGFTALNNDRLFQTENNLGFGLQRTGMCERQRGGVAVTVMHRVVVHVGPNQGFKFEHAPHGLIGITNLAADGSEPSLG